MQQPGRVQGLYARGAGRSHLIGRGVGRLIPVLSGSGLLALAWWDWAYPLAERAYHVPWQRLLWMVPAFWAVGLALWALASRVTLPFWLALPAGLLLLRSVWHPLGLQPGSSVWLYGLAIVTAAPVCLLLAQIGRGRRVGAFLRRRAGPLVAGAAVMYVLLFSLLSLARHDGYRSHALDLGAMDQAAWNTAQGRFFERTPLYRHPAAGSRYESRLLDAKLELVFFPLAALYRLWPDPRLLLIVQTLFMGAGALPLYLIARREALPGLGALLIPLGYLCYLPLHYVNLADFHPSALMIPFLFAAWYALRAGHWRRYYLWLALALCCRVDAALVLLGLGTAAALRLPGCRSASKSARRHGLITVALGATWLLFDLGLLLPAMQRVYGPDVRSLVVRRFGGGPFEVLGALLARPAAALASLFDRERAQVVWDLLAPLGFVPLLGPLGLLPALPVLLINLLARSEWQHSIYAHYMAPLIPFVWIGAVEGVAWLAQGGPLAGIAGLFPGTAGRWPGKRAALERGDPREGAGSLGDGSPLALENARSSAFGGMRGVVVRWVGEVARALPLLILVNTLLCAWLFSPYPPGRRFDPADVYQPSSYEANLRAVLALVPEGASVCAQSDLHPHLAQRRDVALFPYCRLDAATEAEYVALDLDPTSVKSPLDMHTFYQLVGDWLGRPEYGVVGQQGGALLLQRGAPRASIAAVQAALDAYGRDFYRISWTAGRAPGRLSAASVYHLPLAVRNEGPQIWHSGGGLPVRISFRWLAADGTVVDVPALRTDLPHRVAPGHAARLRAALLTPSAPGIYTLEWNLLREGDAWFRDRGGAVLRQQVVVE